MNKASKCLLVCSCFLYLIYGIGSGQTKDQLERRKKEQLKELEYASSLLEETKENKEKTINELMILNKRIELREELVENIHGEIISIGEDIEENLDIISSLNQGLKTKMTEYEELIFFAFKNRTTYSDLIYVLAAKNINEAYKRYQYLKQLTDYRKRQVKLIEEIQKIIEYKVKELEVRRNEKEILFVQRKEERATLELEKEQKKGYIAGLQSKEKELKDEVRNKEKILKSIESEIDRYIERETAKAGEGNLYERLTPRERIVSKEFSGNKGHLPWPTNKGIITSKFGEQSHPVLRGIKIRNNGIDISTTHNAEVKSVFDGEVTLITAIPGGNYAIIVRHGDFFSVYQNISRIKVKQGDQVETNQPLGYVYSEENERSGVLHFELRREYEKLNPEEWLTM